jgi:histidine phosphotransferase ChpT
MSQQDLQLAALLCSRVCHDVINPVGAIINGLELLEDEKDEAMKTVALDHIRKSAMLAANKLKFARIAFGAGGSMGAQVDLGDAGDVARALVEDGRTKLEWNLPRVLLPKDRVKLLLNLVLVAMSAIARGGTIRVEPIGEGERMGFRLEASGQNARVPAAVPGLLSGRSENGLDAHAIQPFYAGLLARSAGMKVTLAAEGERVVVTAAGA